MTEEAKHDHAAVEEKVTRAAEEQFYRVADDYRRNNDASFCRVCGLIGFRLMQRTLLEQFIVHGAEDFGWDDADKAQFAAQMARLIAQPMPEHQSGHAKRADA